MKRGIMLVALGLLAGCATPSTSQVGEAYNKCIAQVSVTPEFASLVAHGVFNDPSQLTLAQLGDTSYMTYAESVAADDAQKAVQPCRQSALAGLQNQAPALANLFALEYEVDDNNALALIQRRQTWGQYDENRQHIAYLASIDANNIRNQMQVQQAQEDEAHAANWAAISNALRANSERTQNSVSCTSDGMMPGFVNTNCTRY